MSVHDGWIVGSAIGVSIPLIMIAGTLSQILKELRDQREPIYPSQSNDNARSYHDFPPETNL
jgi:hypothetical protein